MEDLDDYLEGELASINEMFEQFQTKDQKKKQRILTEEEELKAMEKRAKEVRRLNCEVGVQLGLKLLIVS